MHPLPGTEVHPAELRARITAALALRPDQPPRSRHVAGDRTPLYTNRLALESSPYLLQHAHNPVNWFAWGDEAFTEARRLGRPIFLSIGYSTCHWCHVMEEESFEDETIAGFLNAHYVSIKVDREERPDVDAVYMRAAQQLSGSGGWPLSVWLTAEREPFFVGTYFPPYAGRRGAGHGFLDLLTELARLHGGESKRVHEAAQALAAAVRASMDGTAGADRTGGSPPSVAPQTALIATAVEQCANAFDHENGGLRTAQKFPSHVPIRLLLRHHQRSGDARALHMATQTLEAMAAGGIYDHVAGGFHRYATDSRWHVPHFEKMLYDNALLVLAYAEAWQVTKQPAFARVVRETCDELLSTFASPEGGFFSATDADSEGAEGKYFVWTEEDIRAVLGASEDTELFLRHYGVTRDGNFEGSNILYQGQPNEDITQRLTPARAKLAEARKRRVPPLRDEKILAAWNGLAISAFAVAGRVLGERRYLEAA
ncbi:MAG TPA: thioredoxin domain-containing protein, partial [Polyangia bacterium]